MNLSLLTSEQLFSSNNFVSVVCTDTYYLHRAVYLKLKMYNKELKYTA